MLDGTDEFPIAVFVSSIDKNFDALDFDWQTLDNFSITDNGFDAIFVGDISFFVCKRTTWFLSFVD